MTLGPSRLHPPLRVRALGGSVLLNRPLSAQAQTPSRPSGGAKEQEPAENEGSTGPGRTGPPGHRAEKVAARRHLPNALVTAPRSRIKVNSALTAYGAGLVVAEWRPLR